MKRILAVDDEEDILLPLREFLFAKKEAEVVTAATADEALNHLRRERFDLIITDVKMPGMSGLDLLTEIKTRYAELPVIVMSAFPSEEVRRTTSLRGGVIFIEKPFDIVNLRKQAQEAMKESHNFRGTFSGITLADVIQLKCMSGVTAALRISTDNRQGVIYFHAGEIIHALFDKQDGEKAFREIMNMNGGRLDTVKVIEPPRRTIFKSYLALLMEASSPQAGTEPSEGSGVSPDEPSDTTAGIDQLQYSPSEEINKPPPKAEEDSVSQQISKEQAVIFREGFKNLKGFRLGGFWAADGGIGFREVKDTEPDFETIAATVGDFSRQVQDALPLAGMDFCQDAILDCGKATLVIYNLDQSAKVRPGYIFIICNSGSNPALARMELKKIAARLAAR